MGVLYMIVVSRGSQRMEGLALRGAVAFIESWRL